MLEAFKNRALLLKLETVEGTDAVPTTLLNAFQIFDGKSSVAADQIERNIDRPFFTNNPFVLANLRAIIEGGVEIVPPAAPGTNPAAVDALLRAAGLARTYDVAGADDLTIYNPVSSSFASATAYWYHAGTFRKVTGARANITGLAMEIGNYLRAQMRLEGSYNDVDEAALPTDCDYAAFLTPRVCSTESMEMLVDGFAVDGKSVSIDFGNQQKTIEHTEARINRINDRRATFAARMYRSAQADFDPWATWKAGSIFPIVAKQVQADTTYTQLDLRCQIESCDEIDIDGDYGWDIKGRLIASDAGGDEFLITFGKPGA